MTNAVEQNVVTLDITMDNVLAVQVGQPLASLQPLVSTTLNPE